MVQEVVVLGHIVSNKGIKVDKEKVEVIRKVPPWTSVNSVVRIFLGHVGFYRQYIKEFSKIVKPLTHLLVKDVPFDFNEKCLSAFLTLKEVLIIALVM